MFWLYRLADHVLAKGPFAARATVPPYDVAVLGVVELHDPHIDPRRNRVTDDGTTWRLATPDEVAAFEAEAREAAQRERARQRQYEEG